MKRLNGKFFAVAFKKAAERLLVNKDEINALNVFPVPDGDTGSNMSAAVLEAVEYLNRLSSTDLDQIVDAVKKGMLMGARGNSGVILSQIFRGFAEGTKGRKYLTTKAFSECLVKAREVAYKSVMKPVEGTMLTVIRVLAEKGLSELIEVEDFEEYFDRLTEIAFKTVDETPKMLDKLKEAGVVDAGAKGLAYIVEGFKLAAFGQIEAELLETPAAATISAEQIVEIAREEIKFSYCTELIIKLRDKNGGTHETVDALKKYLETMGDSIVAVNQDDLIKIHVHTDHPGDVIEEFLKHGDLQKVKIDNMKIQHDHIVEASAEEKKTYAAGKKHGIVAVSPGEGLSEIMKSLGVDYIIKGGQTMNPSLKDLFQAIERLDSENVIVFPNNPNILLTAREAATAVMEKNPGKKVFILETKTVQEGIAALTVYDDELETEKLLEEIKEAMSHVIPISVTYAIRDSSIKGKKVRKGEYLAIGKDGLINSGRKLEKVVRDAIGSILKDAEEDEYSIITVFYGSDVKEEQAEKLIELLSDDYDDMEFEVHKGGQPYYYYLISLE
ncbi:Dak phosphatase [Kosmotoga arenicorallina S304]|uniref:Dak phosphatase n=1 Tax=Kosmotoga arenicorallina S304 TaxID=1453497 RepID=A0A182C7Q5_9BACT|nr:DAK2 domain-containing protein [Kosmotoga arenicorallina]OAA31718.1 Dak phosphatase [Kosmotoga arenicorallina S304]